MEITPKLSVTEDKIRLLTVKTDMFKTACLTLNVLVPMGEYAAEYAVLSSYLVHSSKKYDSLIKLNSRLEEPLSNLDAKLRVQMRIEIAKLHQRLGTTIIYVTHDQTEAMTLGTRIVVMKDGVIQQVDTPQNLYEKPQNLFVAGFMGSPQMNFLDAVVRINGTAVTLEVAGQSIPLPPAKAKKLIDGGYNGKTVVMGIRPEDVYDSEMFIETAKCVFSSTIKVYELLGAEVFLYFDLGEFPMTARVDPRSNARPGDTVRFAFDVEKIHVFDKETEQVITN